MLFLFFGRRAFNAIFPSTSICCKRQLISPMQFYGGFFLFFFIFREVFAFDQLCLFFDGRFPANPAVAGVTMAFWECVDCPLGEFL